eukprot:CAMPEP_0183715860 /NCGR_PEP_ID=MMETSP0737-20130205/9949_1 /TAXON_ID=385413 /ORGANISM="Thalassiosira miniscula, Strain CCMP1093" /LENGTH=44 /DNA_ID= /DNA_START= /DNA_END= /DNA_ORIENTATION=
MARLHERRRQHGIIFADSAEANLAGLRPHCPAGFVAVIAGYFFI